MPLDPRTPVIVGVGQLSQRVDRGEPELEPVQLMAEAARRAGTDSGADAATVLGAIDSIRVVSLLSWRYVDPGRTLGRLLGLGDAPATAVSTMGGNSPQTLVNRASADIAEGRADCVLLAGGEAWRTRMSYRRNGNAKPEWTPLDETMPPAAVTGSELEMTHPAESAHGVLMPVQMYPMFEQARRHRLGRTIDEHQARVGALWARFSEIAATNPHAWRREPLTPEQIITPTADNRYVGFPYTKVMNSYENVDQGAALLLCSADRAERLGIPRERWLFPLAGADAREHTFVSNRADLHSSPAIGVAGRSMFAAAGLGIDDVAHVDLYSCFPAAPQIGADELGLSEDRQLSLTGGLAFAGGPWNNYSMHAIATMADVLRADAGTVGLVWANGGFFTKHSLGLYSTAPPARPFSWCTPQDEVDALARVEVDDAYEGPVTIESWTVMHGGDGSAQTALFAVRTPDGSRAWGSAGDADLLRTAVQDDLIGQKAERAGGQIRM